jgi:hypothetical protein
MPRDERGKNRKFGHHKDRNTKDVTEEDLI